MLVLVMVIVMHYGGLGVGGGVDDDIVGVVGVVVVVVPVVGGV